MSPKSQGAESQARNARPGIIASPLDVIMMPKEQWDRIKEIAHASFASGMLPKCVRDGQAAFMIALKGYEMGFSVTYALEHIVIVNGKASMDGQAMLRCILERVPGSRVEDVTPKGKEEEFCTIEMQRPNKKAKQFTFSVTDAKRAGLWGKAGPWQQYPRMMMRWRAVAEGARFYFPDAISGVRYLPDELGLEMDAEGNYVEVAKPPAKASRDVPAAPESATSEAQAPSPAEQPAPTTATLPPAQQPAQVLSFTKNSPLADKDDFVRVSKLAEEKGVSLDRVEELAEKDMGVNLADQGVVTKQHINRLSFLINNEAKGKK